MSRNPQLGSNGELDALRPPEVEQLVDRGAHAAPGVEHVVDQHDRRAPDVERQRGALHVGLEAGQRIVVAVVGDVDEPERMPAGDARGEAFGDPRTPRVDADESRIVRDGRQHAPDQRGQRRFGVR